MDAGDDVVAFPASSPVPDAVDVSVVADIWSFELDISTLLLFFPLHETVDALIAIDISSIAANLFFIISIILFLSAILAGLAQLFDVAAAVCTLAH